MNDFTMVPQPNYVAELLSLVPSFGFSSEYQALDEEDRAIPGLVFSQFAMFVEKHTHSKCTVEECRNGIERLVSLNDSYLDNLLVTEVFEAFRHPQTCRNLLLPASKALYDRWIAGR